MKNVELEHILVTDNLGLAAAAWGHAGSRTVTQINRRNMSARTVATTQSNTPAAGWRWHSCKPKVTLTWSAVKASLAHIYQHPGCGWRGRQSCYCCVLNSEAAQPAGFYLELSLIHLRPLLLKLKSFSPVNSSHKRKCFGPSWRFTCTAQNIYTRYLDRHFTFSGD